MEPYSYFTADPFLYARLKAFVKELRLRRPTEAESLLWQCLRGNALGVKFRRQHIIGPYIADFCSLEAHLVIELDGGYHQLPNQQVKDQDRQAWLEAEGYKVIRFSNNEILFDIEKVIQIINNNI